MSINTQVSGLISKLFSNNLAQGLSVSTAAIYRKILPGAFNVSTGEFDYTISDTEIDVLRVEESQVGVTDWQGPALTEGATFYIKPPSGVSLSASKDDKIIFSGVEYSIISVSQESFGGTGLVFIVKAVALTPSVEDAVAYPPDGGTTPGSTYMTEAGVEAKVVDMLADSPMITWEYDSDASKIYGSTITDGGNF